MLRPLLLPLLVTDQRRVIAADLTRWREVMSAGTGKVLSAPEFRTLLRYRLSRGNRAGALLGKVLTRLYGHERTLFIWTEDIGPGLFIQHGTATLIAAQRIGANCWISQQVTIGYGYGGGASPVLEDNVYVYAGAKVVGDVTVGARSMVANNAVVVRDVPPGSVAMGIPAHKQPYGTIPESAIVSLTYH